jgi:hypothetical protein
MSAKVSKEDALEELARRLYVEMEHHYPGAETSPKEWTDLDDQDRDYFRVCVESILEEKALVMAALGISETDPTTA